MTLPCRRGRNLISLLDSHVEIQIFCHLPGVFVCLYGFECFIRIREAEVELFRH